MMAMKTNKGDVLAKLQNADNVEVIIGELSKEVINSVNLMILSPGIAIDDLL
ncbi:MAG: hypothetical protein ACLT2Z_09165 [Eubacterium sp.]